MKRDFRQLSASRGFTLIELLVVISIISILAALLMANFVGIRQRGRDAQRKSDLRQIQSALELYRSDNGSYPTTIPNCGSALTQNSVTYMQKLPCDPLEKNNYSYTSDGNTYTLYGCIENENDPDKDSSTASNCTATTNVSFTLTNP
ncbi:MAG TPA: prepilin-type N-terminal cleavage/methylation domain-containing protein [Patescibacteria group bacterium]|nr:prepilin-type N-terminal cleavage/methylation domain-containing protein [Patescibacteria group bacterium]